MNRRRFLAMLPALSALGAHDAYAATAAPAPRVVVLDWGLTETLLAMGVTPVGTAEVAAYQAAVVAPLLPPQVADVGLRLAPSLEWLQALAPDLILINSSQMSQREVLERIAPVHAFAVYTDAGAPYVHAQDVTRAVGALCQRSTSAEGLIAATDAALAGCREQLQRFAQVHALRSRALYLAQFFDARHLGLYGERSMFQQVMQRLDLPNAWHGATDYWGIGVAGLDALAGDAHAALLYFDPLPPAARRMMQGNRLWQALPAPQAGRVAALPPFWGFGMLPSAARFARVISAHLCADTQLGWRPA